MVRAAEDLAPEPRWTDIFYESVPIEPNGHQTIGLRVSSTGSAWLGEARDDRFYFTVIWEGVHGTTSERAVGKASAISARLHLPDGVAPPAADSKPRWINQGGHGIDSWILESKFPWGRNRYDEGWIELRLPKRRLWVQIPYGFTRDPSEKWPEAEQGRESPKLAAAMTKLPAADTFVPWHSVDGCVT